MTDRDSADNESDEMCNNCGEELTHGTCTNTTCEESPDFEGYEEDWDDDDEDEGKTKEEVF